MTEDELSECITFTHHDLTNEGLDYVTTWILGAKEGICALVDEVRRLRVQLAEAEDG